jgi:hypothetical protein
MWQPGRLPPSISNRNHSRDCEMPGGFLARSACSRSAQTFLCSCPATGVCGPIRRLIAYIRIAHGPGMSDPQGMTAPASSLPRKRIWSRTYSNSMMWHAGRGLVHLYLTDSQEWENVGRRDASFVSVSRLYRGVRNGIRLPPYITKFSPQYEGKRSTIERKAPLRQNSCRPDRN